MKRIYIAGPMRGRPEYNFPAFRTAAELFRRRGWIVVSPVEVGLLFGNNPEVHGSEYIREDLIHLARCHAIALLPGWEASTGARCEVAVALTLGLQFFDAETSAAAVPPARAVVNGGYDRPPGAVELLEDLAAEATAWANATFTSATNSSRAAHLRREAEELCRDPDDLEEAADIFMLLAHLTHGRDLAGAVRAKLEKNKARKWGTPDAEGVVEHVRMDLQADGSYR